VSERRRRSRPWILKLGGSLAGSPHLSAWLDATTAGAGRVVVVAGGGPFADAVRVAQVAGNFDDATAHRMALLAMEQYATMLLGNGDIAHFTPAASRRAILATLRRDRIPIWLPSRMVLAQRDIEASWNVTSDSLAAWLARTLGASALILVKASGTGVPCDADGLARDGVVDRAFPEYLARCGCECRILGAADHGLLHVALRDSAPPGVPVL
jgi:5-(aminomethyl)-3-furanmethanol phosphate kinase